MTCQVEYDPKRNPIAVRAENGEESLLYKSLVKKVPSGYTDQHVEAALKGGGIKINPRTGEVPKKQIALILWNKWYIDPSIKEKIEEEARKKGQGKVMYDVNGEPALFEVEHLLIEGGGLQKEAVSRVGMKPLTRFLQDNKLVKKIGNKLFLSEELTHSIDGMYEKSLSHAEVNRKRIEKVLKWFGLPEHMVQFTKTKDGTQLHFSKAPVTPTIATEVQTNTKTLVEFLRDRFPQLQIQYISKREAKALFEEREQKSDEAGRGKLDFDQVNSFTHKGTVYLIEGRVTDQVAAEEALHPFVYTIVKNNPKLFGKLLEAAKKDFPDVEKEVRHAYSDKAGFSQEDRDLELVTQALGRTFKKEYDTKAATSVRSLLEDVLKWFAKLVKDFAVFIGADNKVTINVASIPADATLTSLAQLLNTHDSKFLVDTTAPDFNFSLTPARAVLLERLRRKCQTPLQEKMLEHLFDIESRIYMDDDHVYSDAAKNIYTSTTTGIGGKFDDEEGRFLRNRMFGNDFDMIMDSLAQGKRFYEIKNKVKALSPEIAASAYREMQNYLWALTQDGSVVIPQLRIADPDSKIAGTLDLLLLKPNGALVVIDLKVSKNGTRSKEYNDTPHKTKEGSLLPNAALTTREKQGIQVGTYSKLLGVHGFYPEQTVTYHMNVKLKEDGPEKEVKSFYAEGPVHHYQSEYKNYVDRIVPTATAPDKARLIMRELGQLSEDVDLDAEHDEALRRSEVFQQTLDQMRTGMEEFREKARRRIDRMELAKTAVSFNSPANRAMHKLTQLVMLMGQDLSRGQTQRAYGEFLRYAKKELADLTEYMADPKKREEEGFIEKVLEASNYLETYRGMVNSEEWALGNKSLKEMLKGLLLQLNTVQTKIQSTLEDYVLDEMMKTTSRKEISREEWRQLIKTGTDISSWDYHLGDIDSSTDPFIAVAAKMYKRSKMQADDRFREAEEDLYKWGARLKKAGIKGFDAIYEVDSNGKRTGKYVQKFDAKFDERRNAARKKILDADGRKKQFRKVYIDDEVKNADDIAYNKQYQEDQKEWREFNRAENFTENGPTDGDFYKYKQEFKKDREKYEEYQVVRDADGKFLYGKWVMKEEGVTYEEYLDYKNKYFNFNESYDTPYFEDGEFTGTLIKGAGNNWSVKQEFIEIREIAADGTDMRSEQWKKLKSPTTEQDRVLSEFYDFFTGRLTELLELLPTGTQQEMYGRIPPVRAKFIDQIRKNGSVLFKIMARNVGDWFKASTITKPALYNEDGTLMNQLPVFYTGSLRDNEAIAKMKGELEKLEQDLKDKKINKEKYYTERDRIRNNLRAAESAMDAADMEPDLLRVLGEFSRRVYEYDEMRRIESSLLAVQEILDNRKYKKKSSKGDWVMERIRNQVKPLEIYGDKSYASRRFKAWMEMSFYGSPNLDKSMADVYAKRFMNLTSLVNVGFNFFGAVHNYLMNRITMAIETWGGLYYDRTAGMEAVREYNRDYLPNAVKKMFSSFFGREDYYHREPPASKYEAMCRLFKIPRGGESTSGRPDVSVLAAFGYKLASWAEFNTQSKVAVSVLRSTMVEGPRGVQTSMYDAYDWKPGDHLPVLRQGFDVPPTKRHDTTNKIWEVNKRMFGNYAAEDKMLIERHTLGMMAAQFHKWVYPLGRVRLHRGYVDENLGYQEGRWQSAMEFLGFLKKAEGDWKAQMYGSWDKMNEVQAKNMYRNAAELMFLIFSGTMSLILSGLAEGLGDDDDRMKRLVNFLRYENSRQTQEVRFWIPGLNLPDVQELIKNPFAMAGSFKQYADVFGQALNIALPPYDDNIYYQSGVYKGQLKLAKELKDLAPILKDMNKWTSFASNTDFKVM